MMNNSNNNNKDDEKNKNIGRRAAIYLFLMMNTPTPSPRMLLLLTVKLKLKSKVAKTKAKETIRMRNYHRRMETDYAGGILANQLIRMPTKKYDGGMNAQDRQLLHQMEVDVGLAAPYTTALRRQLMIPFKPFQTSIHICGNC